VHARTRAKNEVHAALMRCLKDRPPASDLFGVKGRRWLAEQDLPVCEREAVDSAVRQVDFLDSEIAQVEQRIAADALSWPEVTRLVTVPGVNVIVAAPFMAAVGDIRRFGDRRKLTAYLGLDPRVRQSGAAPAAHGHISKQGSVSARHALVDVLVPAHPRRGLRLRPTVAHQEDAPPRTAGRRPALAGRCHVWSTNDTMRNAERDLALQAQRLRTHHHRPPGQQGGRRARHRAAHLVTLTSASRARQTHKPKSAL
jgi:transposase